MTAKLTREQIQAMSPDAASTKAANGLCNDGKWQTLGVNDEALWGECKGSGVKPYQTQIELSSYSTRCSCPSRKFPCKHALALLFLCADQVPRLATESTFPQWVSEWIEGRKERAAKKEERAEKVANSPPADPQKQAAAATKRQNTRWKRIESGAQELQRWLNDQFHQGFATFNPNHYKEWNTMAARMVDAQAPGLGRMLQDALSLMQSGAAHQQEAIEQLGLMQVLISAILRKDALSPDRLADVQTALGWSLEKEDLLTTAQHVADNWLILGQTTHELDSRLTERRVWLYGQKTQQYALLLDFAFKGRGLEGAWGNQASCPATLAYYPSTIPLRATVVQQGPPQHQAVPWPQNNLKECIDQVSAMFASNPWLLQVPLVFSDATPIPYEDGWVVKTSEGCFALQINETNIWNLLAFSAGSPIRLFAEWSGSKLLPLAAQSIKNPDHCWFYLNQSVGDLS